MKNNNNNDNNNNNNDDDDANNNTNIYHNANNKNNNKNNNDDNNNKKTGSNNNNNNNNTNDGSHFNVAKCNTNARSNSLWWTNSAHTAFHVGAANVIQMLDPAPCGGPTLHPLHFISVCPMQYKCSIQPSVVGQPCTHCISFRCSQCCTNARSSFLWWANRASTAFHFGAAN